ncbi:IclR family transcriptional regulator [Denitrobaculum tricleocarpae]|uniref:IclR family transcriptional regulator n=1 Tax=Denitrobaculum tricleocarpae TaxID=2591009 RepID=UPI001FEB4E2D|nr:IclR family transcriptional regulator [Denitrobaculum tricleocarpae]
MRKRRDGNPKLDGSLKDQLQTDGVIKGVAGDRQFVTALARGLEILRAFEPGDGPLGNQELAERTGLPKATISRLTYTLSALGYITYLERLGKYQLGTPVLALGYASLAGMEIRQTARAAMQELADKESVSVALGGRDRMSMRYLQTCHPESLATLRLEIGARVPIESTSIGLAFLCALPEGERGYLLERIEERSGEEWPEIRDGIAQAEEDIAKKGFCTSFGKWRSDVHAVGVPLVPRDGAPVMAFNCGGPAFMLDQDRMEQEVGPRLVDLVRRLATNRGDINF